MNRGLVGCAVATGACLLALHGTSAAGWQRMTADERQRVRVGEPAPGGPNDKCCKLD